MNVTCSACGTVESRGPWGMRLVGAELEIRCWACLDEVEIPRSERRIWEQAVASDILGATERAKRLRLNPPLDPRRQPLPGFEGAS